MIQLIGIYTIIKQTKKEQNIDFQIIRMKCNTRNRRGTGKRKGADNFSDQGPIHSTLALHHSMRTPFSQLVLETQSQNAPINFLRTKETSDHLTNISFTHTDMQISNIEPSCSPRIRTDKSSGSISNRCCGLNQILFCF